MLLFDFLFSKSYWQCCNICDRIRNIDSDNNFNRRRDVRKQHSIHSKTTRIRCRRHENGARHNNLIHRSSQPNGGIRARLEQLCIRRACRRNNLGVLNIYSRALL